MNLSLIEKNLYLTKHKLIYFKIKYHFKSTNTIRDLVELKLILKMLDYLSDCITFSISIILRISTRFYCGCVWLSICGL